jgi:penicillin amidase
LSKFSKFVIGFGCTLLIVLLTAALFLRHLVTKSFPVTRGSIEITGLHSPVQVYRDEYGVPHIQAGDEHDLMMATGYVHAQDRLWQMDLMRRAGEGRLSEVLGAPTLSLDKLFRTVNLRDVAASIESTMHPESHRVLEDYAAGVNAYIGDHRGKYPIEFDMLRYNPEPWTVRHSILVTRLIAWELNLAWWTDLTYGEIAAKVSPEMLREIIPTVPDSIPAPVPTSALKSALAGASGFMDAGRDYRAYFQLGSLEAGSNAWAVDSTRSLSGKPLLANDPHLAMPCPSRWYLIHLSAPGWNVAGVSLPGLPLVVIGHNDRIAWGLTNAMIDDADFYVEQIDSASPGHYRYHGASLAFGEREEKIYVGTNDSVTITARFTRHGPVVSDVHPVRQHADTLAPAPPIAMRWTGLEPSDETFGFMKLNRAGNPGEFAEALHDLTVPGQAVVYADTAGNIGFWTAARVPIRGKENAMLPLSGNDPEAEWKGFVPFDRLPHVLNPPEGFVACSNQKLADASYPYYLSTLWEPPSRLLRIRHLLQSAEKLSADDFKQFQQDLTSIFARDVTKQLLEAYADSTAPEGDLADALTYLRNWDFRFTQTDVSTTIFNAFFMKLLRNTYEDDMGSGLFKDFVFFTAIPYRVTSSLLAADSSRWFDDRNTPQIETKRDILRKSLADAVQELRTTNGPEMKTWQWGTIHTVTFSHPFGSRKPLDKVFNLGPYPIGGGGTTPNKSEYRFATPYGVAIGPSMRQVIDLADPSVAYTVITSGQSGQPLQGHYDDQVPLWRNGGYLRVTTDWNDIERSGWDHCELRP